VRLGASEAEQPQSPPAPQDATEIRLRRGHEASLAAVAPGANPGATASFVSVYFFRQKPVNAGLSWPT